MTVATKSGGECGGNAVMHGFRQTAQLDAPEWASAAALACFIGMIVTWAAIYSN